MKMLWKVHTKKIPVSYEKYGTLSIYVFYWWNLLHEYSFNFCHDSVSIVAVNLIFMVNVFECETKDD